MDQHMEDCRSVEEKLESQMHDFIGSLKGDSIVAVLSDGAEDMMMVSKHVLYKTSCEYIVKTLDGWAREATEQTLRFPGWSSEVIHHFLFWAYNHCLQDFCEDDEEGTGKYYDDNMKVQMILARVWLFGDAFKIPKLQNAAMEQIVALSMGQHTSWQMIPLCWEETTDDENFLPLRQFAVDEARHEFFNDSHSLDLLPLEMEKLGKTPGLITEILNVPKQLLREHGKVTVYDFEPGWVGGWKQYAVKED